MRVLGGLRWGEIVFIWVYAVLNIGVTLYSYTRFSFYGHSPMSALVRTFGHLINVNLGATLLPVTRNSVWMWLLRMPFERANKYHRIFGRMTYLFMSAHFGVWMIRWSLADESIIGHINGGLTPRLGFTAWAATTLMALFSLDVFRRSRFELFYYVHHLFLVSVTFATLHTWVQHGTRPDKTAVYVLPGALLYFIDRVQRFRSGQLNPTSLVSIRRETYDVVRLELRKKNGFPFRAGQYVFVNVPSISWFQWHPFSISSSPGNPTFSLLVKDMGKGTWTHQLALLSMSRLATKLKIKVDGPYGSMNLSYADYGVVVLVCGGIGVTPIVSLLKEIAAIRSTLPHLQRVYFVWVVRKASYLMWFQDYFAHLPSDLFEVSLYVTRSKDQDGTTNAQTDMIDRGVYDNSVTSYKSGRPNLDNLFARLQTEHADQDNIAVLCSGPPSLLDSVSEQCFDRSTSEQKFDFSSETFFL